MRPTPGQAPVRWARELDRRGDRVALLLADGQTLTYAGLLARADAIAARLDPADGSPARRLVALLAGNDVDSIAALLGCYRAGHPVLLLGADSHTSRILDTFRPDTVISAAGIRFAGPPPPAGTLHPDLALLLPTSGSTGSPKLVRLSEAALAANAAAIIDSLGITPDDRAMMTLPIHYSFGLSVLHSHLMAGASLIVNDLSVTHPDFEPLLTRLGATSIAGVPHTYELLERSSLLTRLPASVTTLTQAGGRLSPERVRSLASLMAARGGRFFVLYGQTEAAPRMACLPPEYAATHPECIGRPIPGGRFRLIDENGQVINSPDTPGELIYEGPNVMMGYAHDPADLARGPELTALPTGDLATCNTAGLYRIVGRVSRFAKIAGLRISFDDLESQLAASGLTAVVTGDDQRLTVLCETATDPATLQSDVAARSRIPAASVVVVTSPVPRLPSGKTDYPAIRRAGAAAAAAADASMAGEAAACPLLTAYRKTFNRPELTATESFQSLGGDSLSYVSIVVAIEAALGRLPPGWESMPIATLEAMRPDGPAAEAPRPRWRPMATETVLRLGALTLVMIGHASPDNTQSLRGGATVLFMMAGYHLARFQRPALEAGRARAALTGALERLVLPYLLVMVPLLLLSKADKSWSWFAMLSVFFVDDQARGPMLFFWFIETVFHALLITLLVFRVPALRRLSRNAPFSFSMLLLGGGLAAHLLVPALLFRKDNPFTFTIDGHYWLYALGWAAAVHRRRWQEGLLLAVALGIGWLDFGNGSSRPLWLAGSLLLLLSVPSLPVPAPLHPVVMRTAASGYFIYIAHALVNHTLKFELNIADRSAGFILLFLASSIAAGLVAARLWNECWNRLAPKIINLRAT